MSNQEEIYKKIVSVFIETSAELLGISDGYESIKFQQLPASLKIKLFSFSTAINVNGVFSGYFLMSIDDKALNSAANKLFNTDIPDDDASLKQECLNELLNIVLGNSTSEFAELGYAIDISTPLNIEKEKFDTILNIDNFIYYNLINYEGGNILFAFLKTI